MRDAVSEARLQLVYPETARRVRQLDQLLEGDGIHLRVTQGLRTWPEQAALWAKGRTLPGEPCRHDGVARPAGSCAQHPLGLPVTKAKAGQSMHNYGIPVDAQPDDPAFPLWHPDNDVRDDRWKRFLAAAQSVGLAEGAEWRTFPDFPHLYPEGLPANPDDEIRMLMEGGGKEAVWHWADQQLGIGA